MKSRASRPEAVVAVPSHPFWSRFARALIAELDGHGIAAAEHAGGDADAAGLDRHRLLVVPAASRMPLPAAASVVAIGGGGGGSRSVVASDALAIGALAARHLHGQGARTLALHGVPERVERGVRIAAGALGLRIEAGGGADGTVVGALAAPPAAGAGPLVAVQDEDALFARAINAPCFGPAATALARVAAAALADLARGQPPPRRPILVAPPPTPAYADAAQVASDEQLARALAFIGERFASNLAVEEVASAAGVSTRHLQRIFAQALGRTPLAELHRVRVERSLALLGDPQRTVAAVARAVGFAEADRFTVAFRRRTGQTPGQWRAQRSGRGADD